MHKNGDNVYIICQTWDDLNKLVLYCKSTGYASFDFETHAVGPEGYAGKNDKKPTGFQWEEDSPSIIGFSFQVGSSYVVPLNHFESPFKHEWKKVLKFLSRHILEDQKIVKIAHNAKFEHKWLKRYGCDIFGRINDTMLMKYILDEEIPHGLKPLVGRMIPQHEGYDDEVDQLRTYYGGWGKIPLEPLAKYNALDTDLTLRVFLMMERTIMEEGLYPLYRNMLMMAHRVLAESEYWGMLIDKEYLLKHIKTEGKKLEKLNKKLLRSKIVREFSKHRYEDHIEKLIAGVEAEIHEIDQAEPRKPNADRLIQARQEKVSRYLAGELTTKKEKLEEVNFNSPKQMIQLLFESPGGFQFEPTEMTDSGQPSTNELVLLDLKQKDSTGFIANLLSFREIQKLYSTYLAGMLNKVTPDNTVHAGFLIHGTVTGRLSSRNPNLQNIPRDTTSSIIKPMFISPPGYVILQLDYSQAELRVMADMAGETTMLKWFNTGRDVHLATACKKWGFDYDEAKEIMSDEDNKEFKTWKIRRKQAKTINFGIIYEEGPGKLAEGLSDPASGVIVDRYEAQEFLNDYFKQFPKVKKFINRQHRKAINNGYVNNLFGRRRRLFYNHEDVQWLKDHEYGTYLQKLRQSTNAPVQGTASDFALFSSILIRDAKLRGELPWDMTQCYTVHDSLGFYIQPKDIHEVVPILSRICENPETKKWFGFQMKKVRMKVDFEIGKDWGHLKGYDSNYNYTREDSYK
jgi:DNA polymerase I-like protein with 3'-5' exonuclease and polymerase domains